jgi:hypothetical protein
MEQLHLRTRESKIHCGFDGLLLSDPWQLTSMFNMSLYVLLLLFSIVAAQERDKFCIPPKPPLPLPACTVGSYP